MQYFGGKQRIASDLVEILKAYRVSKTQLFFEPFLGGCNVVSRMDGRRAASDANGYLIAMYRALQSGWLPPENVTADEYASAKAGKVDDPTRAFIGFGCSFAGKWFGGFAKSGQRNYATNARNSLLRKAPGLQGVALFHKSYEEFRPTGCLIYCDPPYQGTTQYGAVGQFDTERFWSVMRGWAVTNTVLVSEYKAPAGCEVVWEKEVKTDIRGAAGKALRTEKLFVVRT